MQFDTEIGEKQISWQVELTWRLKRTLYTQDAIDGGVVDTIQVIQALWPAEEDQERAIKSWSKDEVLADETLWDTPFSHLTQLCVQIGAFLWFGMVPPAEESGEIEILPFSNEPPDSASASTPLEQGPEEGG